ncbi:tripartite tricarboxylate transporter substrate-binding protein [Caenimonas terrae]|uniref:Tripartite tricarboxylate transporter substrate-binding protein n=1 Tax=Caenimonas terrae TaxID=696074 RepID=A0ABW0ND34_9BURK
MNHNPGRRRLVAALAAAPALVGAPALVRAQSRMLTIFLTVPPGTSSDTLARMLGDRLHSRLNRTVIVESKSGAGGLVAIQALKNQEADGSYLMMAPNSAVSLLPLFSSKPTFDLDKDLQPVVECASAPTAFTVNPASGVATMAEYVESVRKSPKQGSIGVPSPVSMGALVIYQLGKQLNLPLQAVPYRGGAPLLADLLGNQVPCSGSILPDYLEMHRAGKLRVLAHCSDKRSPLAPDIPTLAEAGYPGYVAVTSFGLYAKAGIPANVAADYAAIVNEALASAPVVESLHRMGLVPVGGTPEQFKAKVLADRARWAPVIKESGIRMDS